MQEGELKEVVRKLLLGAFTSQHETVRKNNFVFFERNSGGGGRSISQHILGLLRDIYDPEHEQLWLRSAVPLLLAQCKKSSDY